MIESRVRPTEAYVACILPSNFLQTKPLSWSDDRIWNTVCRLQNSGSSRHAKRISVSAKSIFSKPPSKAQKAVLSRIAKRQAAGDDSGIDYSDIPALTDEQLAQFR